MTVGTMRLREWLQKYLSIGIQRARFLTDIRAVWENNIRIAERIMRRDWYLKPSFTLKTRLLCTMSELVDSLLED